MARYIHVVLSPPYSREMTEGRHVVVFDVLRATTSIATALFNGAAGIIPVSSAGEAIALAATFHSERVLKCGEEGSVRIEGFDLDNSPASFPRAVVEGKTLVMCTTNGTRALRAAATAASVRACALVNRSAVACALADLAGDIVILCAGDHGSFALEDAIGAGALVDALRLRNADLEISDAARAAALLFRSVQGNLAEAVAGAQHARRLAAIGFAHDVAFCANLDILDVVPDMHDNVLQV